MKSRIAFLDGIRGWASFAVLLSHTIACFFAAYSPYVNKFYGDFTKQSLEDIFRQNYFVPLFGIFLRFFSDGHLAVLIFFVLSGFALSANHLDGEKRNLALATISRYFRLSIPIITTSLIAYFLLRFNLMYNLEAAITPSAKDWVGSFYNFDASLENVLRFSFYDAFFQYDRDTAYNTNLWTMPIEIMGSFYIYAYLGVFRTTIKISWKIISLILILLIWIFHAPLLACFFTGYIIAELYKKWDIKNHLIYKRTSQIALTFIFFVTAILSVYIRGNDYLTFLMASAIVFSVTFSTYLRRLFSANISEFLGKISFPLYLIQIPIICSLSSYLLIKLPLLGFSSTLSYWINLVLTLSMCLLASMLLLPIEKLSTIYSKKIGNLLLKN